MATKVNLVMDQAATFSTTFTVLDVNDIPIDFTNYTATSQMRQTYTSLTSYVFGVTGSNTGQITMTMNAATTNSISAGRYVYDVEVIDNSGIKSRIVEGIITVTPQVTR